MSWLRLQPQFCEALDKCVWESALHINVTISLDKMEWGNITCSRSQQISAGMSKMQGFKILFYFLLYFLLPETLCWRSYGSLCLLIKSIAAAQL